MEKILFILLGGMVTSICLGFWYALILEDEFMPIILKISLTISMLCLALMSWAPLFIE